MSKTFTARVSKKERKTIDLAEKVGREIFKISDERLLQGAKLDEIALKSIVVKEQVRTKFNDDSIKDLAKNIEVNGLIQPLVLHRDKGGNYRLICGERRFRALSYNKAEKAPCFVLENKTEEELMAIQFSENSSREELHYVDKADGILNYQVATEASERKIQAALGISKSEVHRSLLIAKMPCNLKEAAKKYDIEKYVLLEWDALSKGPLKGEVEKKILEGGITKRSELASIINNNGSSKSGKKSTGLQAGLPKGVSASAFLKAMSSKTKDLKLDKKTQELLRTLVEETKEMMDQ
ncbi:MAG: ParB/RepB/Spo0J family partition protein [Bacteriovorax sp.]|jgi:ParB family chromosome partitioning protein|nr:ParB/RepB/Spo0J family partition protein [Bacteriovorax sp.]